MTQEEKDLLLRDLLPRLQYGVKIHTWYGEIVTSDLNTFPIGYDEIDIEQLAGMKPYLRPMSSMTADEKKIYMSKQSVIFDFKGNKLYVDNYHSLDYLNSIHVDYRGLIEKELAVKANEEMYK